MKFILLHQKGNSLGKILIDNLNNDSWTHFFAAIAYVKKSGVQYIKKGLANFSKSREPVIIAGVDDNITSKEGLEMLLETMGKNGKIYIFHHINTSFHPKLYLFYNSRRANAIIGSGNLSCGGLFTNFEASISLNLNMSYEQDKKLFNDIIEVIHSWHDEKYGDVKLLSYNLLKELEESKLIGKERMEFTNQHTIPGKVLFSNGRNIRCRPKLINNKFPPSINNQFLFPHYEDILGRFYGIQNTEKGERVKYLNFKKADKFSSNKEEMVKAGFSKIVICKAPMQKVPGTERNFYHIQTVQKMWNSNNQHKQFMPFNSEKLREEASQVMKSFKPTSKRDNSKIEKARKKIEKIRKESFN